MIDKSTSYNECKALRIAYLLSRYPAVSHTFFLKEILGLRALGCDIACASVNLPDRPIAQLPAVEAQESSRTYYLKGTSYSVAAKIVLRLCFSDPLVLARGLRTTFELQNFGLRRSIYNLFYLAEALLLGEWMKNRKLHHLHVHFGGPVATVAMLAARSREFSYSMTLHGPDEFFDADAFYLAEKIRHADFIFCISDYCRSQVMKYCEPGQWDKLHVLRLGVDTGEFTPAARQPLSLAATPGIRLVCIGRLVPAKGQHILLRALASLLGRGIPLHLTLVGDGPDRSTLEAFVRSSRMEANVTFAGALNHDQARLTLATADIFILASFAEGIPVSLMEAMAMEIPCISTYVAGIPELIRDEIDGLLVPASSIPALVEAIARLALDPALRERLGNAGRQTVLSRYNLPTNLKALAQKFADCVKR